MNREGIKTLILTMLVIMSLIFTQKIWLGNPLKLPKTKTSILKTDSENYRQIKNQIMIPKSINISFGNSYYTKLVEDRMEVWNRIIPILQKYFLSDIEVQEIAREKYLEAGRLKAIELEFGDNIPSVLISSIFNTVDNKIVSNIEGIKNILMVSSKKGIIYIRSNHGDVYEIKLNNPEEFNLQLRLIDEIKDKDHIRYYPLFADADNNTILPINYDRVAETLFVESSIDPKNEISTQESIKTFFNNSLDFVKTIKETSGALVYMYGYGEKGVRISSKGRLEYTEEQSQVTSTNVLASLDKAIEFILQHNQDLDGLYLERIDHMEDKGYFLGFGYYINDMPVAFTNNKMEYPIEIKVYGDKVRDYKNFLRKEMNLPRINANKKVLLPQQIIEKHIELLESYYLIDKKDEKIDQEKVLSHIERKINKVEMMYYDTTEDGTRQLFLPIWKIQIDKRIYYFDSYSGELLDSHLLD